MYDFVFYISSVSWGNCFLLLIFPVSLPPVSPGLLMLQPPVLSHLSSVLSFWLLSLSTFSSFPPGVFWSKLYFSLVSLGSLFLFCFKLSINIKALRSLRFTSVLFVGTQKRWFASIHQHRWCKNKHWGWFPQTLKTEATSAQISPSWESESETKVRAIGWWSWWTSLGLIHVFAWYVRIKSLKMSIEFANFCSSCCGTRTRFLKHQALNRLLFGFALFWFYKAKSNSWWCQVEGSCSRTVH